MTTIRPNDEELPIYLGVCCREWILAFGHKGRCGLCGIEPVYVRMMSWSEIRNPKPTNDETILGES